MVVQVGVQVSSGVTSCRLGVGLTVVYLYMTVSLCIVLQLDMTSFTDGWLSVIFGGWNLVSESSVVSFLARVAL